MESIERVWKPAALLSFRSARWRSAHGALTFSNRGERMGGSLTKCGAQKKLLTILRKDRSRLATLAEALATASQTARLVINQQYIHAAVKCLRRDSCSMMARFSRARGCCGRQSRCNFRRRAGAFHWREVTANEFHLSRLEPSSG